MPSFNYIFNRRDPVEKGMSKAHLKFSTDILRRLGEELNPNPDQGILELVKNAYDADANTCTIQIRNTQVLGGTISVSDDGEGMEKEDIENSWLLLGKSAKNVRKVTRLGRIPAGNKGLGRLAALRLGTETTLLTRPLEEEKKQYSLFIDWRKFDQFDVVEEVDLEIEETVRASSVGRGTEIRIANLRYRITRNDVKRLARGLLLLADPFGDNPSGFQPILKAPEFEDLEKLVQRRYFDDAEFHLFAEVDTNGQVKATVTDWKGNKLFAADHDEISPKVSKYNCPPATFDIWAYILSSDTFSFRPTTVGEVKAWLKEFGGVHLYIHGLRVSPYGNPGNDWLDMNLSRVRDPELRPGTNTSIGRMAVIGTNEDLLQKTDRSGLVESELFHELKRFATDALDWMHRRRKEERESKRQQQRQQAKGEVDKAKQTIDEAIKLLPSEEKKNVEEKFKDYDRARTKETVILKKEVQLYRTLSTAGITAGIFAHESKHPLRLIEKNAKLIENRAKTAVSDKFEEFFEGPIGIVQRQAEILKAFGSLTLNFIDHEKRRVSRVDIHKVISDVVDMFALTIKERKTEVRFKYDAGNPYLRASEAAIESIISNIITNSLKAFETAPPQDRLISVETQVADGIVTIVIADNGPGISGISLKDIWLPGETTYPNGTGLGLTIVRDTVKDLGGSISALSNGSLGGAEISVELPILGA